MKILQWNITSYYSNFEQLQKLINQEEKPTCICLQETRHKNRNMYPPSGYKLYKSINQRSDEHERGVAILVNKSTHSEELEVHTNDTIEAVAVKIYDKQYYTVCSIYLSPSLTVTKREIVSLINQLPRPALLLGDFNAKHNSWNEINIQNTIHLFSIHCLKNSVYFY